MKRYATINLARPDWEVLRAYTKARGMSLCGLMRVLAERLRNGLQL